MKKFSLLRYFSAVVIIMGLCLSCSKHDKDSEEKKEGTVYDIDIRSKHGSIFASRDASELKKQVFAKLLAKEPIKPEDITQLLIEEQVKYYIQDTKDYTGSVSIDLNLKYIDSITSKSSNIEDIKVLYQTKLQNPPKYQLWWWWTDGEMKYNKDATSLPYIFWKRRLQCFSATMLHQLILRYHYNFKNMNSVVIYESGHILSGYMKKVGNSYKLVGIENTVTGKGIKEYKDLASYTNDYKWIRVVDSELFAILEIFKNDISNINEVAKQMLDITAKKYNLNPSKYNYEYNKILTQNIPSSYSSNGSPLSFGNSNVPGGDLPIVHRDTVDNDNDNSKDYHYEGEEAQDVEATLDERKAESYTTLTDSTHVLENYETLDSEREETEVDIDPIIFNNLKWYDIENDKHWDNNNDNEVYVPKTRLTPVQKRYEMRRLVENPTSQDGKAVKVCVSFVKAKSDEDGHECDDAEFNVFFNNDPTAYPLNLNNECTRAVTTISGKSVEVGDGSDVPGTVLDKATWQNGQLKITLKSGFDNPRHRLHDGVATVAIIGKVRDSSNELRFLNLKSDLSSLTTHGNYTEQNYKFTDFELEDDMYTFDDYCNVIKVNGTNG